MITFLSIIVIVFVSVKEKYLSECHSNEKIRNSAIINFL